MTQEKRLQIIGEEIKKAERDLGYHNAFCGASFSSDIYTLPNGRKVQLKIELTADDDDFDTVTSSFKV